MGVLSLVIAAAAPGAALLAFFYLKDRYNSEPVSLVLKMFLLGVLLVFPMMVIQYSFLQAFGSNPFVASFIISAGLEEFFKWFIVYFVIYKHSSFDEPYDGIMYAVSVSLGFATLENIFYAFLQSSTFLDLMIRALLPVPGHALFGVLMGFHLGKAKFMAAGSRINFHLLLSLFLPIFYHGLFDFILVTANVYWVWFIIPLMTFLWIRSLWKMDQANKHSPFRLLLRDETINIS